MIVVDFDYPNCTFFKSKKIPLKMEGLNEQEGADNIVTMFKNGDDL